MENTNNIFDSLDLSIFFGKKIISKRIVAIKFKKYQHRDKQNGITTEITILLLKSILEKKYKLRYQKGIVNIKPRNKYLAEKCSLFKSIVMLILYVNKLRVLLYQYGLYFINHHNN